MSEPILIIKPLNSNETRCFDKSDKVIRIILIWLTLLYLSGFYNSVLTTSHAIFTFSIQNLTMRQSYQCNILTTTV